MTSVADCSSLGPHSPGGRHRLLTDQLITARSTVLRVVSKGTVVWHHTAGPDLHGADLARLRQNRFERCVIGWLVEKLHSTHATILDVECHPTRGMSGCARNQE